MTLLESLRLRNEMMATVGKLMDDACADIIMWRVNKKGVYKVVDDVDYDRSKKALMFSDDDALDSVPHKLRPRPLNFKDILADDWQVGVCLFGVQKLSIFDRDDEPETDCDTFFNIKESLTDETFFVPYSQYEEDGLYNITIKLTPGTEIEYYAKEYDENGDEYNLVKYTMRYDIDANGKGYFIVEEADDATNISLNDVRDFDAVLSVDSDINHWYCVE